MTRCLKKVSFLTFLTKYFGFWIKEFSNCLGILVGVFEFHQEKILENPHYWLACLDVLRTNPEFRDMYNMLRKVVNLWNHNIKIRKDSLTSEQRNGYYKFIENAPLDLIEWKYIFCWWILWCVEKDKNIAKITLIFILRKH